MRKSRQEIKEQKVLEEILSGAELCRVAMMDGNVPYVLPFNYGYHKGCIYIHSAPEGKKIDLLKAHPEVAFEITQTAEIIRDKKACKWATRYRSVVGQARVEIGEQGGFSRRFGGNSLCCRHAQYCSIRVFRQGVGQWKCRITGADRAVRAPGSGLSV